MRMTVSNDENPWENYAAKGFQTHLRPAYDEAVATGSKHLQDMVLDSLDVGDFLQWLSECSGALAVVNGHPLVDCAVALYRRPKVLMGGGNTARARALNEIQECMGRGACMTALQEGYTVVISETASDKRWPEYAQALLTEGVHSVLAIPLILEHDESASLNFFSAEPSFFLEDLVASAQQYAAQAQKTLRLAVRISSKQQLIEDLLETMKARTAINLAVGVIMGQQRCSQAAAFEMLSKAASSRTQKLRDVAQNLLQNSDECSVQTHFDH